MDQEELKQVRGPASLNLIQAGATEECLRAACTASSTPHMHHTIYADLRQAAVPRPRATTHLSGRHAAPSAERRAARRSMTHTHTYQRNAPGRRVV